ncbi:hypothetical protein Tco_0218115 [Tanacetum coccineum]
MINQQPNATEITINMSPNFWKFNNVSPNGVFGNKVYGDDLKRIWCESSKNHSEKCLDSGNGWGVQGFEELMTVNNRICPTFKEACFAYGLLNDDKEWTKAISEASLWALGPQL